MASYSLAFKASVEKDFVSIPKSILPRIVARIEQLKSDPFPNQSRKLQSTEKLYRLRVGEFRAVYEVHTAVLLITIHLVRHRREVYRHLK